MADAFDNLGFQEHSADELKQLGFKGSPTPKEVPSKLESAARGAAQSVTMGLADEATGAGEAGINALTGKEDVNSLQDLLDSYKKHRDESRANYAAAEDANPGSYFAGSMAGALVPGIGIGGEIAQGVGAAGKIANAAKTGALAGGAFGFGTSEGEKPSDIIGDTAKGALGGAVLGGGLSSAGQAIAGTANAVGSRSQFLQDLLNSTKRGMSGEELAGTIGKGQVENSVNSTAHDIAGQIQGEIQKGSDLKAQGLQKVQESGSTHDLTDLVSKYQEQIQALPENTETQKDEKTTLQNLLNEVQNKTTKKETYLSDYGKPIVKEEPIPVDNDELNNMLTTFKNYASNGKEPLETAGGTQVANGIVNDLKTQQLGTVAVGPQTEGQSLIQQGNQTMSNALKARDLLMPAFNGLNDVDRFKMEQKLAQLIRGEESNTGTGAKIRPIIDKALDALKQTNPDLSQSISDKITDRATAYDLAKKIGAESNVQGSLVGTVKGKALGAANLIGQGINKLNPNSTNASQISDSVKSFLNGSTPETLEASRDAIMAKEGSTPLTQDLDTKLKTAQETDNPYVRNASLFAIMQNPSYRKLLGIDSGDNK